MTTKRQLNVYIHPAKDGKQRSMDFCVAVSFSLGINEPLNAAGQHTAPSVTTIRTIAQKLMHEHNCHVFTNEYTVDPRLIYRYSPAIGWRPFFDVLMVELAAFFDTFSIQTDPRMKSGHIALFKPAAVPSL